MDIVLVDKGKDHIEVEIRDTSAYVLLEPLRERLLQDPSVDIATVDSDHPVYGKRHLYKEDWRKVFEPEHVKACIHEMLHPEKHA